MATPAKAPKNLPLTQPGPSAKSSLQVKAYRGDAKTLLAFNLAQGNTKNLAGFTIQCQPKGQTSYYLFNQLQFQDPSKHAQDPKEPPYSSINAPFQKFRWLHVPGSAHQGLKPFLGPYSYTVTPRFFDSSASLLPLDPTLSVSIDVDVLPFERADLSLGFTRGFTQSQAFVRHFGLKALIRPNTRELLFDTSQHSGTNANGDKYTFQDEYEWLGFTARKKIFDLLNEVIANGSLKLDVFAYDLNEPDLINLLLTLAPQGRIRIILDDAALHHVQPGAKDKKGKPIPSPAEDQFEQLFRKAAKGASLIQRGHFSRYSHDKVFIVSDSSGALKVLTGSTNFSVTGFYVNSNHVLLFNDRKVAAKYEEVFSESLEDGINGPTFRKSPLSSAKPFSFDSPASPTDITFSPHTSTDATTVLDGLASRIQEEGSATHKEGSVLFAVMQIDQGNSPVYDALNDLHSDEKIFSYGISDGPKGISLYKPGNKTGVLVTGKPTNTQLPPPFNQVPEIEGFGHQIHHKFVVCGFNGPNPVVYCGSSNLAIGGETDNGDNLLAIHDAEVATVFAIEAIALVDHFNFLDRFSKASKSKKKTAPPALKQPAAAAAKWFLSTDKKWVAPYFDAKDLHCADRELFA